MTRLSGASIALTAAAVLITACTPRSERDAGAAQKQISQSRVLNMAIRYEIASLYPKIPPRPGFTLPWFNAALTRIHQSAPAPFLAEVPRLNTDTWRVFPDGRMETTYKLRPGLTWHDGQPLTADDFVFAWQVSTHSSLGVFSPSPQSRMETVVAPDERALVIHWKAPYPDANSIGIGDLDPLPRHILDQAFAGVQDQADAFLRLPYWTSEYIGAGPYRVVGWEPGVDYQGAAFDNYVLGRPNIDRIVMRIIADENTVLTNVLAGSVDYAGSPTLRFEHGQVLMRDWVPTGKGAVLFDPGGSNAYALVFQMRPEYAEPAALLDIRTRRAIVHSLDRASINEGVFDGQGSVPEFWVQPTESFYPEVDRAVVHYPYGLRRTEQLMNEAGFVKGRDGFFVNAAGERLSFEYRGISASDAEKASLIMADGWRRAGIEARFSDLAPAQLGDAELRNTFPGIAARGAAARESNLISAGIGTSENRWVGDNRGGWSNPEYDRLYEAFQTTLDRAERARQYVEMLRLVSEHLPMAVMYMGVSVEAWVTDLQGPKLLPGGTGTFTRAASANIHEWEWQ